MGRIDPEGRFEQLQPLGEGTTARVLAAVDRYSGRPVVLKLARDPEMAQLFRGEVNLLRRLSAPVFPELLDFHLDSSGGVELIVMERRQGATLETLTSSLDPLALARLLAQLAQGLVELASLAHLHGDLSPGNVLLDHDRASLLDLGLARAIDDGGADRSGTIATMAPERLSEGRLHPGGDVWSLGVLGWSLICGHAPFPDDPDACIRAILQGQRLDPGAGREHPLMPLCESCLQLDPERRPSALQVLHALLALQPDCLGPELVPRRPAPSQVPAWCLELQSCIEQGRSGAIHGPSTGDHSIWLEWLLHGQALAGHRQLHMNLGQETPLDWARRHLLRHPGLAGHPWLHSRLQSGRKLPTASADLRLLLNALLDFLPVYLGHPLNGLVLETGALTPDALVPAWDLQMLRLCQERGLPLVRVRVGLAPELPVEDQGFRLLMPLPAPGSFRQQLAVILPGLELDTHLLTQLDDRAAGILLPALDLLRLNLARQRIHWQDGRLILGESLLQPEGELFRDPESLGPARLQLLTELGVWSSLAGQALWFQRQAALDASPDLARLEAEALVRDRGDGVLAPVPALWARIDSPDREAAHRRIFGWLIARTDAPTELLLEHLAACGNQAVERDVLLKLAESSSGQGYPEARIQVLERALEMAPADRRLALYSLLVQALQEQGKGERAHQVLRLCFGLPDLSRSDRLQALSQLGHLYLSQGRSRLARRAFALALDLSRPDQPGERLKAVSQLALALWQLGRIEQARGLLEEGSRLLTHFDPPWGRQLSYQANLLAALAFGLGDEERAAGLWQELLGNASRDTDPGERVRVRMNLALMHARREGLDEAERELAIAASEARSLHLETVLTQVLVNQAHIAFLGERLEEAQDHLRDAESLCLLTDDRPSLLPVLYAAADVNYRLAHLDPALDQLERLEEQSRLQDRPSARNEAQLQRLLMDADLGLLPDPGTEEEFLLRCRQYGQHEVLRDWGLVAASMGRVPEPEVCADCREGAGAAELRLLDCLEQGLEKDSSRNAFLDRARELPATNWALRDRLLLNLCFGLGELSRPPWLEEEFEQVQESGRFSPFQRVMLGVLIGQAKLRSSRLAQAGEALGKAVKVLRKLTDSKLMKGQERYRSSPVMESLARSAQTCQHLIRGSNR